jgi:hypothetical protein
MPDMRATSNSFNGAAAARFDAASLSLFFFISSFLFE